MMYENKKVFILGLAKSGYAAAKFLLKEGATVLVNDIKAKHDDDAVVELTELGATFVLGHHPVDLFDDSFDILVKNPGVPLEHVYVKKAESYQIPVLNELEIGFRVLPKVNMIAITGTNGKTTTTTLIYEFLKAAKKPVHLIGNIGLPLCSIVDEINEGDFVVCEIAALQLINTEQFHANVAVFTNLTPDHIDFFKTFEKYASSKALLFKNQTIGDTAILNGDQQVLLDYVSNISATKKYFSTKENDLDAFANKEKIYIDNELFALTSDIRIMGLHNYENIMAAVLAVREYDVPFNIIREVLSVFKGVEHRIEFVNEYNGVTYYNDSKGTNIDSTIVSLRAITQPIILLLGGLDRGQDFYRLAKEVNYVKMIVAYGETKERILEFSKTMMIEVEVVDELTEATTVAYNHANEGDCVLLSPACASWDQFDNFEVRGRLFKKVVKELHGDV